MAKESPGKTGIGVNLFGGPAVTLRDARITLSPFQQCLVAAVFGWGAENGAHHGQYSGDSSPGQGPGTSVARRTLTRLLWKRDTPTSRHRLSQHLYTLAKKCDGAEIFHTTQSAVAPGPGARVEDLERFWTYLAEGRLDDALSLHALGYLSDVSEMPSRSFEEWHEAQPPRIERAIRSCAERMWRESIEAQSWARAWRAADALLRIDPYDEEALRRSLLAGGMVGRVGEALTTFHAFSARRESQTCTWTPHDETRTLVDRLESLPTLMVPSLGLSDRAPEREPTFCGREEELSELNRMLARTGEQDLLDTVVVTGEGGIGKTRLVHEALRTARIYGFTVLSGSSSEFERHIPLNPLLEALSHERGGAAIATMDEPWRSVLLTLLPGFLGADEPLPAVPYLDPGHVPRRTYEALTLLLAAMSKDGPTLLFLDDFQWADDTSVAAVEFVRRRWSGGRLVVVLAVRPPDPGGHHKVAELVQQIEAAGDGTILELDELDEEAVAELILSISGDTLSERQRSDIAQLSGRNPFFAVELTNECRAGHMKPDVSADVPVPIPVSVQQLLERRVRGLGSGEEEILSLLAVSGRALPLDQVEAFTGRSRDESAAGIDHLRELRLVRWQERGATIHHPLVRHAVYNRIPDARRCVLHERVGEWLAGQAGSSPGELALHFDRAGHRERALENYLKAADDAEETGAIPEAVRFLTHARRNTDDPNQMVSIVARMGHLYFMLRDFSKAAPLLEFGARNYREHGAVQAAILAEARRLDALCRLSNVPVPDLVRRTQELKAEAKTLGAWECVARVLEVECGAFEQAEMKAEIRNVIGEARTLCGRGTPQAECVRLTIAALDIFYGRPFEGIRNAQRAMAIAKEYGFHREFVTASNRLLLGLMLQGRFELGGGEELFDEVNMMATRSGDLFQQFSLMNNRGLWHSEKGEFAIARSFFDSAETIISGTKAHVAKTALCLNRGECELLSGNSSNAMDHFRNAQESMDEGNVPEFVRDLVMSGLGVSALHIGQLEFARRIQQSVLLDRSDWTFDPYILLLFAARLCERRAQPGEGAALLAEACKTIEGRFVTAWIKLKVEEARLRAKYDRRQADLTAQEGIAVVNEIGFEFWKACFKKYLKTT